MLENFDDLVTDRRLTLAGVERHLAELEDSNSRREPMLFGEYRVMASGGTSGQRGVFVYGRDDWTELLAAGPMRVQKTYFNFGPRLPRRRLRDDLRRPSPRYDRAAEPQLGRGRPSLPAARCRARSAIWSKP